LFIIGAQELARFIVETKWYDLPESIVQETRLILMESIGRALAALTIDKGKMNVALARIFGGSPESSIIGIGDKVSCSTAALTNSELMATLDYHNMIAGGHDGLYVIPTVMAIAESLTCSSS
jgi:2-methylcitrate dehydratase PrpD